MNQKGMNHFVNQSALNLCRVIAIVLKQLIRQVNLVRLKGLPPTPKGIGKGFRKTTFLIPTIASGCSHAGIPHNWDIWNLTLEVLVIESNKHSLDVRAV
jgi:hypothetical protein